MSNRSNKLSVAALVGQGGGDFIAIQRAKNAGLIDFETVFILSTSSSSAVLKNHPELADSNVMIITDFGKNRAADFQLISEQLNEFHPDLILLCGFTFLLPAEITRKFQGKIVNSHHALLPAHPGLFKKEKLLQSDDKFLGATLHLVDEGVDTGKKLYQCVFPNPGMSGLEFVLKQYRFAQDCMIAQLVRDWQGVSAHHKESFSKGIYFEPAIDNDLIAFFSKDIEL